jgi:uncharacterized membrane protein YfcA
MTGQDPMLLLEMTALLAAVGSFAGLLAGLLGVGGGIVLVPAFFFVFTTLGYASAQLMQLCVATSLATIVVTSARSVSSHHRHGAVDWGILRGWAPGIVLGAILGVLVVAQLRTTTLQFIFGGLAFTVGLYMAFSKSHWRLAEDMPRGPKRMLLAPIIGCLSVLVGVGGGSFGVPLMSLHGTPMHRAVATAAGFGLLIAVPSVIGFLLVPLPADIRPPFTVGLVNLAAFVVVICTTMLTAPIGARLAHRLDAAMLRRVFAVFLLLVAANMIRKALGG